MMRWIIKIILFPISLLLSILTTFMTFILGIGTTILYFLMLMCIVAAIGLFMQKDVKYVASAASPQRVGSTKATLTGISGLSVFERRLRTKFTLIVRSKHFFRFF